MAQAQQVARVEQPSLIRNLAVKYDMDPNKFAQTVKKTCIAGDCSDEDFAAFLMVAKEYDLNPIVKEIFAFPKRGGGIQPIVSVDGWISMINRQPTFNGMEFEDKHDDKGKLLSITCRMYRKDRDRPVEVTEYMAECARGTDTWKQWPARMLRHKSAIQCARYAFGFSGIMEPDEFERSEMAVDITPRQDAPAAPTRTSVTTIKSASSIYDEILLSIRSAATAKELSEIWAVASRDGDLQAIKEADPKRMQHLSEIYNATHQVFADALTARGNEPGPDDEAPADERSQDDNSQANDAAEDAPLTDDEMEAAMAYASFASGQISGFTSAKALNNWFNTTFKAEAEKRRLSAGQIDRIANAYEKRLKEFK